jgi:hypothetical protein
MLNRSDQSGENSRDTVRDATALNKLAISHGHATREITRASLRALSGHGDPGKFGRMFPALDPLFVEDDALAELAAAMKDPDPSSASGDNPAIPAGFTYLGQFVDHDITLDLTPLDEQEVDPLATQNFRSPGLDLDSVYGPGPALAPYMFQRDQAGKRVPKFLIGTATESQDQDGNPIPAVPNDLPRTAHGRAVIGDERNDENLLVAQTHLAFLKFHNAVIDWLAAEKPSLDAGARYDEARRIVTWHYQWMVLYDFVERLTEPGLVDDIRHQGRRFYRFKTRPYMPVEFAAAAYRLGHSMVRESYSHNRVFRPGGLADGTLGFMFFFTGKSGAIIGDLAPGANAGDFPPLGAQATLPSNWAIDWRRFYDFGAASGGDFALNPSRKLDPFLVPALHTLPGEAGRGALLPFRNLRRGVILELPSGQDVAKAMGQTPLAPGDIDSGPDGAAAAAHGLHQRTPLWYYILKEAEVLHGGTRLGPVGATIIAEVFLGLVHGDHQSFLWQRTNWKPELPRAEDGKFTMVDMLNFVGDINPVG